MLGDRADEACRGRFGASARFLFLPWRWGAKADRACVTLLQDNRRRGRPTVQAGLLGAYPGFGMRLTVCLESVGLTEVAEPRMLKAK